MRDTFALVQGLVASGAVRVSEYGYLIDSDEIDVSDLEARTRSDVCGVPAYVTRN